DDPFGLRDLGRHSRTAVTHQIAACHGGELIDRGRRRQGREAAQGAASQSQRDTPMPDMHTP
ncbi:MAG: hypothetical protein ABSH41_29475, partial [Syntrophobacteraceae bacterium]